MPLTPKIEITKAILSKYQPSPQKNIEVYEIMEPRLVRGSDVILQCVARRGYPRAVFKWFKDGERIRAETKELFNRSKLRLKNIQRSDEGTYKCFASNIMGEHETTTELRLESKYAKYRKPTDCGYQVTVIATSFISTASSGGRPQGNLPSLLGETVVCHANQTNVYILYLKKYI